VTRYLIDSNALQEMHARGHANVRAWRATVDDHLLHLSVVTFHEATVGLERERKRREAGSRDASDVIAKIAALEALAAEFDGRIFDIDRKVGEEWGRMLAASGKHDRDTALAATARVHDLVLVTRNIKHIEGRDVLVLDPFVRKPVIVRV
jgi:predicted nucleic acid-binding protein